MNGNSPQNQVSHTVTETNDARFRTLVMARTGLVFGPRRHESVAGMIQAAAYQAGCVSLDEYFLSLQSAPTDSGLWDDLIPRLTVSETYFFRDPGLISALRDHILPELIIRHRTDHNLRLWSAGCSTGEEPYTLGILLRQRLLDIACWRISILATDINRQALAQAAAGRYRPWSFRQTDPATLGQYFTREENCYDIDPQVRAMVTFDYLNLAEPSYPAAANQTLELDLILWRNVSIYLPENVTREVVDRLYNCLSPGGWLVVGPSETNADVFEHFQVVRFDEAFVYRKPLEPGLFIPPSSPFSGVGSLPLKPNPEIVFSKQVRQPGDEAWEKSNCTSAPQPPHKPEIQEREASGQTQVGVAMPDDYQDGLALLQKGQAVNALQCFLAYQKQNPGDAAVYCQIARLHANGGRISEAKQWAERALEHNPLQEEAYYTLALIHHEQGELEAAVPWLIKAIYLKPNFVMAHVSLADIYQQLGRRTDAIRHRTQAVRLASRLEPDAVLPGGDDMKAGHLLGGLNDPR